MCQVMEKVVVGKFFLDISELLEPSGTKKHADESQILISDWLIDGYYES